MALDQKDLSAIARTLADLLAPQVREVASELIAVRVEAATQGLRDGHEAALAQLTAMGKQIVAERDAREAAFAKAVEDMGGMITTVRSDLTALTEAAHVSFEKQFQGLSDKLPGLVGKEELQTATDGLMGAVNKVAASIPEVPTPVALTVDGELSSEMCAAIGIAAKQVFQPMLEARAKAVDEQIAGVQKSVTATSDTVMEVKGLVDRDLKAVTERIEQNQASATGDRAATVEAVQALQSKVLEVQDALPGKLLTLGKEVVDKAIAEATGAASGAARTVAVEIINRTAGELKVSLDEFRQQTTVTISEAVKMVPTLVEGQAENMLKAVLPTVKDLVVETAIATATAASQTANEAHATTLKEEVLGLARSSAQTATQERFEEEFPLLSAKVHDSIVEKTIAEVLLHAEDAGKRAADTFIAGVVPKLHGDATAAGTAAGTEAGAAAGTSAAAGMVPAACAAAETIVRDALPGIEITATNAGQAAAKEFLEGSEEVLATHAREAGAAAGTDAGIIAGTEAGAKTALEMVNEARPSLLVAAKAAGDEAASEYITKTAPGVKVWAEEAGREAGAAAALNALPELQKAALAAVEEAKPQLEIAARTAGGIAATEAVTLLYDHITEKATVAGREAGAAAALHALPELQKAALNVVAEATPEIVIQAGAEGSARAAELLAANHDSYMADATAAGAEAGAKAALTALPDMQKAALSVVTDATPDILKQAAQAGADKTVAVLEATQQDRIAAAAEAGRAAGMTAAVKAVPDAVLSMKAGIEEEILPKATAAANTEATRVTNSRWDEVKEAATTVSVAKSLHAISEAVPGLVAAQAEALGVLVQPGATAAAVAAAKTLGEAAVALAREQAGTTATAAATAAAGALRDQLLTDLDPTERVELAVEAKIEKVTKELGDAISDAMETHIKEEMPALHLRMMSKIQAEVDRLPRPENGKAGMDGKDARVEPPLPHVEGKMYEQGSWCSRDGSVWVAARHTDLVPSEDNRDWYCVVHGIKNITATLQSDLRTLSIVTELGGGTLVTNSVKLDVPITKGLYKSEYEYSKRDIATFDGSWWEALKDGPLPAPGTDPAAWKLHIKRGANAPAPKTANSAPRSVLRGDWMLDTLYQSGDQVDHAGYRWMAIKSTRERPPFSLLKSNDIWTMLGASV